MQLEQQESFEIKGPQLEVFGEAETRLPAAATKRPAALAVLAVAIVASVLGIGGAQLKGQWRETSEIYTSQIDDYGNGIQQDFSNQADAAASDHAHNSRCPDVNLNIVQKPGKKTADTGGDHPMRHPLREAGAHRL